MIYNDINIDPYEEIRRERYIARLKAAGLSLCMICGEVFPTDELNEDEICEECNSKEELI